MLMDYRDIIDDQHNYTGLSKCMKVLCKQCNKEYIDFSLKYDPYQHPDRMYKSSI